MRQKTDGRGLYSGEWQNTNHEITREIWMEECFPDWGTYLNNQIEAYEVPKGQVGLWWIGGASWVLKTDAGGIFWIDMFSGSSGYTELASCGVCRQAGADSLNWLSLPPHVIDPWKFKRLDGCFISHVHQDHCDIYSVKPALQTTDALFYGPKTVVKRLEEFDVPRERIVSTEVGQVIEIPGGRVRILPCYDNTAIRTGGGGRLLDYDDCCVCFLFETSGGNILFMADTWFHDAYVYFPEFFDIDVVTVNMGYNYPGATDKLTPYDVVRIGECIQPKVIIPDHYDNLAHCAWDPSLILGQFERLAKEMIPQVKTVIMQHGGMFLYPQDQNIGHYRYPQGFVGREKTRIAEYNKLAAKFEPK